MRYGTINNPTAWAICITLSMKMAPVSDSDRDWPAPKVSIPYPAIKKGIRAIPAKTIMAINPKRRNTSSCIMGCDDWIDSRIGDVN